MTLFHSFSWLTLSDFTTFPVPPSTCQNHCKIRLCCILSTLLFAVFFFFYSYFLLLFYWKLEDCGLLCPSLWSHWATHPRDFATQYRKPCMWLCATQLCKRTRFLKIFIYLFGCAEYFHCGTWDLVSWLRIEPRPPLHRERRVFTTGPPGKLLKCGLFN